jgi:hypothetical protein
MDNNNEMMVQRLMQEEAEPVAESKKKTPLAHRCSSSSTS